ncbi:CYFA0S11e01530g1_1 [Cyberlindnera fabianii]|uniref:CYFA0S11e01530g1_1 n=1 Tax=Cyberlindnera fabianii TaxID=36022 RepID=A0A061B6B1_CYBFA|nr:CYFA0S11e01530g1_1 [Cyberlindnera fabianii]
MLMKDADNNPRYESLSRYGSPDGSTHDHVVPERVLLQFGRITLTVTQLRYSSFLLLGVALLWPWNCFLSASGYFIAKFGADSPLGKNYSSTMMTVSTLTSLCFNSVLSTRQNANYSKRIFRGNALNFSCFVILALIELIDPNLHSTSYFVFIMLLVLLSSLGTALQQNGCMALANVRGPEYAQGTMVGQAIAGVLPSLSLMISELIYSGHREKSSASIVIYFAMTSVITLLAGILFVVTYKIDGEPGVSSTSDEEATASSGEQNSNYVPFMTLFNKLKFIVLSIVMSFVVTLIFPIFASNVTSVHTDWKLTSDPIFIPFAFLVWNIGDLIGRIACGYENLVITNDVKLFVYTIARFVFVPFLLMCNLDSRKGHAVIKSDTFYLLIQFLFGFTNGHSLSCAFMNVGPYVEDNEKEAAGGFSTVFLSVGLLLGSVLSYIFVPLVG